MYGESGGLLARRRSWTALELEEGELPEEEAAGTAAVGLLQGGGLLLDGGAQGEEVVVKGGGVDLLKGLCGLRGGGVQPALAQVGHLLGDVAAAEVRRVQGEAEDDVVAVDALHNAADLAVRQGLGGLLKGATICPGEAT